MYSNLDTNLVTQFALYAKAENILVKNPIRKNNTYDLRAVGLQTVPSPSAGLSDKFPRTHVYTDKEGTKHESPKTNKESDHKVQISIVEADLELLVEEEILLQDGGHEFTKELWFTLYEAARFIRSCLDSPDNVEIVLYNVSSQRSL